MAKGIVITASGCWFVQEFDEPLYKSVGKAVGGYIETVNPRGLASPYVLIVNEEGAYNLPVNLFGSLLCDIMAHGSPIYGNAVIMKEGLRNGEPDVVGLSKRDLLTLGDKLKTMHLKEVKVKGEGMKNKVEIGISVDQSGTLNINATGSGSDIMTTLAMAVIDITAEISATRAKGLREKLCALVMAAPVKVDYSSKDFEKIVAEALNRVNGTSV